MVRYCGWYSNKMRGLSPPPLAKLPSKHWRDLILRVWYVDPLRCPVYQISMRVIAVMDELAG
jgi:hypothetical protein